MAKAINSIKKFSKVSQNALRWVTIRFCWTHRMMHGVDSSNTTKATELILISKTEQTIGVNAPQSKLTQDALPEITEKTRPAPSAQRRSSFTSLVTMPPTLLSTTQPREHVTITGPLMLRKLPLSKEVWQQWELDHHFGTGATLLWGTVLTTR